MVCGHTCCHTCSFWRLQLSLSQPPRQLCRLCNSDQEFSFMKLSLCTHFQMSVALLWAPWPPGHTRAIGFITHYSGSVRAFLPPDEELLEGRTSFLPDSYWLLIPKHHVHLTRGFTFYYTLSHTFSFNSHNLSKRWLGWSVSLHGHIHLKTKRAIISTLIFWLQVLWQCRWLLI